MKKTIIFLTLALMLTTCLALPKTNYTQVNTENIPTQKELRRTQSINKTTEIPSETTTAEIDSEYETYIYKDKSVSTDGNKNTGSYSGIGYEPVEIAPYAAPSDTLTINGISINIGDSISAVTSKLGKPVNTIYVPIEYTDEELAQEYEPVTNAEGETETTTARPLARADENAYGYDGFTIYTNNNKAIEKVEITSPSIPALKGISPIGRQVFELADSYGGPVAVEGNIYKFAAGKGTYMYFDAPGGTVNSWGIIGSQ